MAELVLAVAVVVAGAAGWLLGAGRARAAAQAERERLAARAAAAEALGEELRRQLAKREQEAGEVERALETERGARLQAEVRMEALRQSLEEQRGLLESARERLAETFRGLSAEVLRESGAALLEQARQAVDAQFARRQEAIDAAVRPLQETLQRYEAALGDLEARRQQAYGGLQEQLRALAATGADLQREAGNLATALRTPHVRGRWGELTLHRVVELAGLAAHCDYVEQVTVEGEGGRLRPDLVVRLPGGRQIVVDAKAPLSAYLDAVNAASPEERQAALARHAQQVRQHLTALAGKGYWSEFARAADFVVMFLPGEPFLAAAAQADPTLLEDAVSRGVLVATPTTLIAVLRAVALGWRQQQVADNAERIRKLGQDLYERLRVMIGHLQEVGEQLGRATGAYNRAVGSLESRVLPAARRFRELGAAAGDELGGLAPVDQAPRPLDAPEAPRQLDAPGLGS